MIQITFPKKASLLLISVILLFALAACTPEASAPAATEAPTATATPTPTQAPTDTPTPATATPQAEPTKNNEAAFIDYANTEFGLIMKLPSDWSQPEELVNENGLTMMSFTESMENNVIALVRAMPTDTFTLEEYNELMQDALEESYDPSMILSSEIITIDGVDFLRIIIDDTTPGEEMCQLLYASLANDFAYEIVFTLSPDYFVANADVFSEVEQGIQFENIAQ